MNRAPRLRPDRDQGAPTTQDSRAIWASRARRHVGSTGRRSRRGTGGTLRHVFRRSSHHDFPAEGVPDAGARARDGGFRLKDWPEPGPAGVKSRGGDPRPRTTAPLAGSARPPSTNCRAAPGFSSRRSSARGARWSDSSSPGTSFRVSVIETLVKWPRTPPSRRRNHHPAEARSSGPDTGSRPGTSARTGALGALGHVGRMGARAKIKSTDVGWCFAGATGWARPTDVECRSAANGAAGRCVNGIRRILEALSPDGDARSRTCRPTGPRPHDVRWAAGSPSP